MKRILFISVNDWVPWGGSEVLWSEAAHELAKNSDYEVLFYAKYWSEVPFHYKKLEANCKLIYRGTRLENKKLTIAKRLVNRALPAKYQYKPKQIDTWYDFIKQHSPDLIVLSLGDHNSALDWTDIIQQLKIKYALIVQLAKDAQIPSDGLRERISEQYINAHRVFFVSEQNKKLLQVQCANPLENSEVIFNPTNLDSINFLYPSTENDYRVAFIASLSSNHKGHDMLFQVLAQEKWKKRKLKVNLYGTGPHKVYLKKLKNYLQIDNVIFCGFETDKKKIWRENHAFILPSRMEGMSLALLEAMSAGRTPITTNVGGALEVIDNNITGFVAQAATVEFIDEALERAWIRRNEWKEIGRLAAKKVNQLIPDNPVKIFAKKLINIL